MKFLLISFLLLISISSIDSFKEAKDFFIEFIKTVTNGKVLNNLSEQCFGKSFEYHILHLKKNYHEANFEKISRNLENIAIDIFLNCPNYELITIFNETKFVNISALSTNYKIKIYKQLFSQGTSLYSNYYKNNFTGAYLGREIGQCFNLFKENGIKVDEKEMTENDAQKEIKETFSFLDNINQYFDIIGGIFVGMKEKDDDSESKCYNDILKGKSKIINFIEEGLKKMENGKGFAETLTGIIFNLISVEGLVVDCNLLKLGGSIISKLTSLKELTELYNKIMKNSLFYLLFVGQVTDNFKKNNMKEAGKYIGKIISNIFDFHVQ